MEKFDPDPYTISDQDKKNYSKHADGLGYIRQDFRFFLFIDCISVSCLSCLSALCSVPSEASFFLSSPESWQKFDPVALQKKLHCRKGWIWVWYLTPCTSGRDWMNTYLNQYSKDLFIVICLAEIISKSRRPKQGNWEVLLSGLLNVRTRY